MESVKTEKQLEEKSCFINDWNILMVSAKILKIAGTFYLARILNESSKIRTQS